MDEARQTRQGKICREIQLLFNEGLVNAPLLFAVALFSAARINEVSLTEDAYQGAFALTIRNEHQRQLASRTLPSRILVVCSAYLSQRNPYSSRSIQE